MHTTRQHDLPQKAPSGPPSADDADQVAQPSGEGRGRLPSIEAEGLAEKLSGLARRLAGELADRDARDVGHVLEHLAAVVDHAAAAQVAAVQQAEASEATVESTGLPTEAFLRTYCDRTGGDARMLAMAAEVLADMPQTFQMLVEGTLTWGTIRGVVRELSRSSKQERGWVDGQLAGDPERLRRLGPDGVVDAVGQLLAEAAPKRAEAKAERARRRRFASFAYRLDGIGQMYAEGTIADIAAMQARVEAQMARDDRDGRDDTGDGDGGGSWKTAGRRTFDALHTLLVGRTIDGETADLPEAPGRQAPADAGPSKEMLDAVVDIGRLEWFDPADGRTWGQLLAPAVPGVLPLTGKSLARHADDVVLQAILVDDGQIVGVTAPEDRIGGVRLYVTVDIGQVASLPDNHGGWPGRVADLCADTVWMTPPAKKRLDGGDGDMLQVVVADARIHTLGPRATPSTSPRRCGPPCWCVTASAGCPAAGCRRSTPTPTTSPNAATVATPSWTGWCCCATSTTAPSTNTPPPTDDPAGRSIWPRTARRRSPTPGRRFNAPHCRGTNDASTPHNHHQSRNPRARMRADDGAGRPDAAHPTTVHTRPTTTPT